MIGSDVPGPGTGRMIDSLMVVMEAASKASAMMPTARRMPSIPSTLTSRVAIHCLHRDGIDDCRKRDCAPSVSESPDRPGL